MYLVRSTHRVHIRYLTEESAENRLFFNLDDSMVGYGWFFRIPRGNLSTYSVDVCIAFSFRHFSLMRLRLQPLLLLQHQKCRTQKPERRRGRKQYWLDKPPECLFWCRYCMPLTTILLNGSMHNTIRNKTETNNNKQKAFFMWRCKSSEAASPLHTGPIKVYVLFWTDQTSEPYLNNVNGDCEQNFQHENNGTPYAVRRLLSW